MGNRPGIRTHGAAGRAAYLIASGTIATLLSLGIAEAQHAPAGPPVELRVRLEWSAAPLSARDPAATIVLEPVDRAGDAALQKLRVSASAVTVVRLTPGRYQLTTTAPLIAGRQAYGWNIELALFDPVNSVRLSAENAVRLESGDLIEPAHGTAAAAQPRPTAASAAVAADPKAQIVALLGRWASSLRARDLNTHMGCYAPELARYLQQRNVSRQQVRVDKQKFLHLYTDIDRLELLDVDVNIDGATAVATAVKWWNFSNHETSSRGRMPLIFEFAQVNSRWAITSEWQQLTPHPSVATASAER